jgi:predicted RNase H-like HicB family nuclease
MAESKPREYDVVVERDAEGFYVASVPVLPGAIRRRAPSMN